MSTTRNGRVESRVSLFVFLQQSASTISKPIRYKTTGTTNCSKVQHSRSHLATKFLETHSRCVRSLYRYFEIRCNPYVDVR
jgi:hypothetical protein